MSHEDSRRPMGPERNIRLLFEYDGAPYIGWQAQPGQSSVEETLKNAVMRMTGFCPKFRVAGRTDAGVHAAAQVCNFTTLSTIPIHRFAPGLNHYLPKSISIHEATEVAASFDARLQSVAKRYRYRIYSGTHRAALETRAWHIRTDLDIEAMEQASQCLIGEHDFNAFRSTHCEAAHAKREMFSITITRGPRPPCGERVSIVFCANAFCRHMCRILAGTLIEVGMGRRTINGVAAALDSCDRRQAGMTAPAFGLTLLQVQY